MESVADIISPTVAGSIAGVLFRDKETKANVLSDNLYEKICSFSYVPTLVQCFIFVLGPLAARNSSLKNWPTTIASKCDDALSAYMLPQVYCYMFISSKLIFLS